MTLNSVSQSKIIRSAFFGVLAVLASTSYPVWADTFKYAISSDVQSIDPQFANVSGDRNIAGSVFDALTKISPDGQLIPNLALSWKSVDPLTWEFKLRQGVKFQDGSLLSVADIVYSLQRANSLASSPATYGVFVKYITSVKSVGSDTIRITTAKPFAILPNLLAMVYIVSQKATTGLASGDFTPAKGAMGTGPYRLTGFSRGDRATLERWDGYWGPRPEYDNVTVRFIPNAPARVAALIAGDVDAILNVPLADVNRIKSNPAFQLYEKPLFLFMFWSMNTTVDHPEGLTDKAGKPLPQNPFRDVRVRRAFSKAIDRNILVGRVLQGLGVPTQNSVPAGVFGYDPSLTPDTYDLAGAKRLMAEAGYPECFSMKVSAPNDRYVADGQQAQAVAQMLSRLGCKITVETAPMGVYITRLNKLESTFFLIGWSSNPGDVGAQLSALFDAPSSNPYRKTNIHMYHSPAFRAAIEKGIETVDKDKRLVYYNEAVHVMKDEVGVIPTHIQIGTWAARKGISVTPTVDEQLYPAYAKPSR